MKFNKTLASMAAAAALLAAPLASHADVFQLRISDGVNVLLIEDQVFAAPADGSAVPGKILYAGTNVFGDWDIAIGSGTSNFDPLAMHLTASFSANSANFEVGDSRVLTIELTQTGLSSGPGTNAVSFSAKGGGSDLYDNVNASWAAFADDADADAAAAFGTGTPVFSASGFNTASGGTSANMTGLYSATLRAVFDVSGISGDTAGSLDLTMRVPEPGTIALAGLALMGLGLARRRQA